MNENDEAAARSLMISKASSIRQQKMCLDFMGGYQKKRKEK